MALEAVLAEIEALGASLIVVSPQVKRSRRESGDEPSTRFEILVDRGNAVARRYGLVHEVPPELQAIYRWFGIDLDVVNGDGRWELPMPARFVIDRAGIVRSNDADPDYTRRPEPEETLAVLRALEQGN